MPPWDIMRLISCGRASRMDDSSYIELARDTRQQVITAKTTYLRVKSILASIYCCKGILTRFYSIFGGPGFATFLTSLELIRCTNSTGNQCFFGLITPRFVNLLQR
jgi:hypothetical protein